MLVKIDYISCETSKKHLSSTDSGCNSSDQYNPSKIMSLVRGFNLLVSFLLGCPGVVDLLLLDPQATGVFLLQFQVRNRFRFNRILPLLLLLRFTHN